MRLFETEQAEVEQDATALRIISKLQKERVIPVSQCMPPRFGCPPPRDPSLYSDGCLDRARYTLAVEIRLVSFCWLFMANRGKDIIMAGFEGF